MGNNFLIEREQNHSIFRFALLNGLFLIPFSLFIQTVCPTVYWLDTGEFLAALSCLGLPHSPSFPVFLLINLPLKFLPFGDIALRGNLSSVIFGALLAVISFKLIDKIQRKYLFRQSSIFAALAALFISLNPLTWYQCLKSEVYTLNLFLLLMILFFSLEILQDPSTPKYKTVRLIVLILCLGFGNHLLLAAHIVPALILVACFSPIQLYRKNWLLLLFLSILFASLYLYLPLRSAQNPILDLGNPERWENFVNCITRRGSFGRFFGNRTGETLSNVRDYLNLVNQHFTYGIWLLVLPGIALLYRKQFRLLIFLLVAGGTNIFVTLMNKNFNVNPDTGPAYLMLSSTILVLLGFCGLSWFLNIIARRQSHRLRIASNVLVCFVLVVLIGTFVHSSIREIDLSSEYSAQTIGKATMENLVPNAILFTGFRSNLRYVLSYLQAAEKFRTDVTIIDRGETTYWPGGLERVWSRFGPEMQDHLNSNFLEQITYLAPRGARHSKVYQIEQAKDIILNFLARLALHESVTSPVYWMPSEDDILLGQNIRSEGILLNVSRRWLSINDHGPDLDIWSRFSARVQINSYFSDSVSRQKVSEFLTNAANSMDIAGLPHVAFQLYQTALSNLPESDIVLENYKIFLRNNMEYVKEKD